MQETVIFSQKEGFWNDNDGWSFYPSEGTRYPDPIGTKVGFIGISDAVHVNPAHYSHLDYEGSREAFFDSLSQYKGEVIATILTEVTGQDFTYQGDSIWLVGDRDFDDDNILCYLIEDASIDDKVLLDLLNKHASGKYFYDGSEIFYRYDPTAS